MIRVGCSEEGDHAIDIVAMAVQQGLAVHTVQPAHQWEVEGINNKARVITKRCYGVKSSDTLWNRLILDLNRASAAAGRSIAELREIVSGLKAVFLAFCTLNRES